MAKIYNAEVFVEGTLDISVEASNEEEAKSKMKAALTKVNYGCLRDIACDLSQAVIECVEEQEEDK